MCPKGDMEAKMMIITIIFVFERALFNNKLAKANALGTKVMDIDEFLKIM